MGRKFILGVWICSSLAVASFAAGARAGDSEAFEPIDAEVLIDACWAVSKDDRDSGVTGRMRAGANRSLRCMEKIILDQAQAMFDVENLARINFPKKIAMMRKGHQTINWAIYNNHRKCTLFCGTDRHLYHLGAYAGLVENLIVAMIRERNDIASRKFE